MAKFGRLAGLSTPRTAVAAAAAGIATLAFSAVQANAGLTIVPTFDSTITSDTTNAATIEGSINNAISRLDAAISNPITVNITFAEMTSGLGQSQTFEGPISYSSYRSDLLTKQIPSVNDATAIATLPATTVNPVNGGTAVELTTPLLRALGENGTLPAGTPDSTISLNTSLLNLSRTGPQNGGKYDIEAVATHEMDEVLGIGGAGSTLGQNAGSDIGPLDLFRYSSAGTRSFTTSSSASAYFSINGGVTSIVPFNQTAGADYSDWGSTGTPKVQDAFGTPGVDLNLGSAELTALDVVGYNLTAVPEPASLALLTVSTLGLVVGRRRR